MRNRLLGLLLLVTTAVILLILFTRRDTQAAYGPALALCPGPDQYGYRCEGNAAYAYIDAQNDTGLYADDATISLDLPFVFTFYGTPYTEIHASSNGNLQFDTHNGEHQNECLTAATATAMGDLIAPFWDDLDLRFAGYLETETVGESPNRIFVIEWDDVPRYGDQDDRVTFAVQLFETSNDIVFLYDDTTLSTGNNGRSATIGLQSAAQDVALQFNCNQAAVADGSRLRIVYPATANADLGRQQVVTAPNPPAVALQSKSRLDALTSQLNRDGAAALAQWRQQELNATPATASNWQWVDLTGNGRSDLILTQHSTSQYPEQTTLLVFTANGSGQLTPVLHHAFTNRQTAVSELAIGDVADLTHDSLADVLLTTPENGALFVLTAVANQPTLIPLPTHCNGSWIVRDTNENGRFQIVRDGCGGNGRLVYDWNGQQFSLLQPTE